MKRNVVCLAVALFLIALLAGCSSDKGPAESAIKAAEEAFNASKAEAVKYIPDEVKSLEGALAAVKDKFAKGDYKAAIPEAQSIGEKSKGLADRAKTKKEELTQSWTDLSQAVPKMVEAAQSRIDALSKAKKLPANMTPEKISEANSGLVAAREEWAKALESFKTGNLAEAVAMANSVKGKAEAATEILGAPAQALEKEAQEKAVPEKAPQEKVAREKATAHRAPAAKKAAAQKKRAKQAQIKAAGFVGTVTMVAPGAVAVKGQKDQVTFDARHPQLKGYKSIRDVTVGDTVAAQYTKNGLMLTKLGGPAKAKTTTPKKAKKGAPVRAK